MAQLPPKFGPFEPLRRLGAGGMAETFVAVRRGPGDFEQRVCIKRILPAYEEDQEFVRAFLTEARTSAALRHNNIVQVLDFGVLPEEQSHYLALELVEGLDLRALLARGATFDHQVVTWIGSELSAALEYAHALEPGRPQVFHRDVSPSNVLVSRAGEVKLTDFGIARVVGAGHRTATGVIKGKVPYMPPEYIERGRFDERGDLFALGVLLFELLAGERPFDGESELDTLRRIVAGERRPLAVAAPAALTACIERLIARAPEDRFESARALLDALPPVAVNPTRRRLGELVRAHSGASDQPSSRPIPIALPPTEPHVAPPPEPPAHAPSRPSSPELSPPPRLRPSRRAAVALIASASLLGGVSAAVSLRERERAAGAATAAEPPPLPAIAADKPAATSPPPRDDMAASALSPSKPSPPESDWERPPESPPTPASGEEAARSEASSSRSKRSRTRTHGSAELKVVVVPFGEVWVDDRYVGQSPVTLRVPAGSHAIAVGEGRARERRVVRVEAGDHEQVVFRSGRASNP